MLPKSCTIHVGAHCANNGEKLFAEQLIGVAIDCMMEANLDMWEFAVQRAQVECSSPVLV